MKSSENTKPYSEVQQSPSYPSIERKILDYWKENGTFKKSVDSKKDSSEFVFYDGPPFANGLPHYGHILTGFVKDIVPRYQTMRGKKVDRRFGWDCHGLPAELDAEKVLNVSGRIDILKFGIDKFNDACRTQVLKYTKEWESYVTRQARWVSFEDDYKTMDSSYMESVMWAFKALWDKGLVYEGHRVMPYSWAVETPLSNFEIRLDNAYRSRQDPAITVAFQLNDSLGGNNKPTNILIWTTTPWTLPSNLAVAVGREIEYAILEGEKDNVILADALVEKYKKELGSYNKIGSVVGKDLLGKNYAPVFSYFKEHPNSFKVLSGDFVSTEDGTGIVHMAPGFGEEDQKVCEANNISIVCPVDSKGQFTSEVSDFVGIQVQEANKLVIKNLKDRGFLIRHETIEHNYPHCWRTDTPLIYKAVSSWYVQVSKFKDRMVELNQQINWIPDHIKDGQFGRWLENARDWSISRNRFWGSPIPVWKSDDPTYPRIDVYGSIADLEKDFGVKVPDLHRPFIDTLTRTNPDDPTGKSKMVRVEEVLDCWFESGSMPFAQVHYPFENKEWFENHFPADFIVEYVAQTRGWFYTMMVLSTAIFDRPPFKNCLCHGVVLDENGQKLSKRLRNYPDPIEVYEKQGADALRWFLISTPILRGGDLNIDSEGKGITETIRTTLNPLWNAYYFFTLYANTDGYKAKFNVSQSGLLDKYILVRTRNFIEKLTKAMDEYDIALGCELYSDHIDALNNWYIRRSRERFWRSGDDTDKQNAYDTLYTVLVTTVTGIAPLLPLISEEIYKNLTGEESVHLANWPDVSKFPNDLNLVTTMDQIRAVCSAGLSLREQHNLRTRLPLKSITLLGGSLEAVLSYADLVKEELNLKEVLFSKDTDKYANYQLTVNSRVAGPRLGGKIQSIIAASKKGDWTNQNNEVTVAGEKLLPTEYTIKIVAKEGFAAAPLDGFDGVVVLDTVLTEQLMNEGLARDLVRQIQQERKELGFHISDRINLSVFLSSELKVKLAEHNDYIALQTLANILNLEINPPTKELKVFQLGEESIVIEIQKV